MLPAIANHTPYINNPPPGWHPGMLRSYNRDVERFIPPPIQPDPVPLATDALTEERYNALLDIGYPVGVDELCRCREGVYHRRTGATLWCSQIDFNQEPEQIEDQMADEQIRHTQIMRPANPIEDSCYFHTYQTVYLIRFTDGHIELINRIRCSVTPENYLFFELNVLWSSNPEYRRAITRLNEINRIVEYYPSLERYETQQILEHEMTQREMNPASDLSREIASYLFRSKKMKKSSTRTKKSIKKSSTRTKKSKKSSTRTKKSSKRTKKSKKSSTRTKKSVKRTKKSVKRTKKSVKRTKK